MRKIFADTITELAKQDDKIILVISDNGYGLFDNFIYLFPDRFFNLGVCEQSIVGVAAGLSLIGFKPYIYAITPFLIERAFEQIKLDINQQKVNVKLVGYADYPNDGPTHSEINGKEMMGLFVSIKSYFPESTIEVEQILFETHLNSSPIFISLKKAKNG